jgi:hypothetical protein
MSYTIVRTLQNSMVQLSGTNSKFHAIKMNLISIVQISGLFKISSFLWYNAI